MELRITITDEQWESTGDEEDPSARILLRENVSINGTGFHLEGWAVDDEGYALYGEDDLSQIAAGVGADGPFETVTIRGREYALVMTPHC